MHCTEFTNPDQYERIRVHQTTAFADALTDKKLPADARAIARKFAAASNSELSLAGLISRLPRNMSRLPGALGDLRRRGYITIESVPVQIAPGKPVEVRS